MNIDRAVRSLCLNEYDNLASLQAEARDSIILPREFAIPSQRLNRKVCNIVIAALNNSTNSTNYNCRLCGSFIVDTSRSRQDINAEIFHHIIDMHRSDVMLKAEDIFRPYLSVNS